MIGDFNIHMDITDDPNTITFNDFLDSFNLHNHVNLPTHKSLHYLDLVITDTNWNIMHTVKQGHMLSDHNFIDCSLHIEKPKPQTKTVTYRKLKNIDIKRLDGDMGEALVAANNCSDLAALVDMYNVKLSAVLDNHAPQKTKAVKISHCQPWFNDFIKGQIVLRRKKEKLLGLIQQNTTTKPFTISADMSATSQNMLRNNITWNLLQIVIEMQNLCST